MIMNVEKKNQTNKFLVLLFFSSSSSEKKIQIHFLSDFLYQRSSS